MEPEIEKGSAVIADKDETAVLIEGNVILFRQEKGVENVMRIVQVEHSTVDTVYRVAADAKADEIIDVNKNDVVAKCTKESHNLGRVITFLKSVPGILAGMILPCLIQRRPVLWPAWYSPVDKRACRPFQEAFLPRSYQG